MQENERLLNKAEHVQETADEKLTLLAYKTKQESRSNKSRKHHHKNKTYKKRSSKHVSRHISHGYMVGSYFIDIMANIDLFGPSKVSFYSFLIGKDIVEVTDFHFREAAFLPVGVCGVE